MAENSLPHLDRRSVLKHVGASAGAVAGASGIVSAAEDSRVSDPLESPVVSRLLAAIGNPEPDDVQTNSVVANGGHPRVDYAEIETGLGTLRYVVADEEIDGLTRTAYITISRPLGREKRRLPRKYRTTPPSSDLILESKHGGVVASRTAVQPETELLADVSGVATEDMIATYHEDGGYFKIVDTADDGTVLVDIPGDAPSVNEYGVPALQRRDIAVERPEPDVSTLENHCWDLGWFIAGQGPCVKCVQTSAVATACAGVCSVTGGAGCIPCIASIGLAGGACGCCLDCVDHVDAPPDGC